MSTSTLRPLVSGRSIVLRKVVMLILSIFGLVVAWQLAAMYLNNPRILPEPTTVIDLIILYSMEGDAGQGTALHHLRVTVIRVIAASLLALSLGIVLGTLAASNDPVGDGVMPWVPFWMTIPTVIVVLVTMVMFRFSVMSVYIAVIVVATPFVVINIWEGLQDLNTDLLEMAYTFQADRYLTWSNVYVFHLLPYIFSAYRYIFGMVWKIVVLAEVFGLQIGIGAMFRFYYTIGEIDSILAYLILFLAVMVIIEYIILEPLESWLFRWRKT